MATYIRLTDYKDRDSKEQGFFKPENRYEAKQEDFAKIPGSPIAYWVSDKLINHFELSDKTTKYLNIKNGLSTGDNEKYIRFWMEVDSKNIGFRFTNTEDAQLSKIKWFPCNKGGEERKWFGNNDTVLNWYDNGKELKDFGRIRNNGKHWSRYIYGLEFMFKKGLTYTYISSSIFGVRFSDIGFIPTNAGSGIFEKEDKNNLLYFLGFFSTKIVYNMLQLINPTIKFETGDISKLPIIFPKQESTKQLIDSLTQECIDISKEEWDSRETSWDFTKNELLKHKLDSKIETAYNNYCQVWSEKFYKLHANEEELNRLFIDIYELGDELTPDVALKDITILKSESIINDRGELEFKTDEIMKQFISYAVGVMFGRYSLDKDGLQIANLGSEILISQMTDDTKVSFPIDDDNVIPVLEDDYFSDDIASRVINFVKTTFGAESLSENINFIEKCLGKTIRAYMLKDFYEDHIKRYKKRPIYWMVSSPKKGFMSLSYMHRYTNDLFARVQNNYLREYITKLEGTKDILRQIIVDESASSKDKKDADKKIKDIENRLKELISFDRDVLTSYAQNRVDIDLDDGVKVNYNKFKEVLYPIKGLDKE